MLEFKDGLNEMRRCELNMLYCINFSQGNLDQHTFKVPQYTSWLVGGGKSKDGGPELGRGILGSSSYANTIVFKGCARWIERSLFKLPVVGAVWVEQQKNQEGPGQGILARQ